MALEFWRGRVRRAARAQSSRAQERPRAIVGSSVDRSSSLHRDVASLLPTRAAARPYNSPITGRAVIARSRAPSSRALAVDDVRSRAQRRLLPTSALRAHVRGSARSVVLRRGSALRGSPPDWMVRCDDGTSRRLVLVASPGRLVRARGRLGQPDRPGNHARLFVSLLSIPRAFVAAVRAILPAPTGRPIAMRQRLTASKRHSSPAVLDTRQSLWKGGMSSYGSPEPGRLVACRR